MSRFHLSTALSIISIGIIPMASCTTTTSATSFKNVNETVNITFQNMDDTVGHGHTVEGETTADTSKDYRCRFVSATYELPEGVTIPTHKQLKPKNLEVICNNTNIISSCSLKNNVLIIPADQLKGNITINLMGAEIADWVTWDTICQISDKEIQDRRPEIQDKTLAKNYFQVGDYKMCKEGSKDIGYATIIGFDQQDYVYMSGAEMKYAKSPFTFEMLEPIDEHVWGKGKEGMGGYNIPSWEDDNCSLTSFATQKAMGAIYGFAPRSVNLNKDNSTFSYFYVLSLTEQTGMSVVNPVDTSSGDININDDSFSKAKYSYYKLNEYKSFELDHVVERVRRSKTRWVRDKTSYHTYRLDNPTWVEYLQILFSTDYQNGYYWHYRDVESKYCSSWAFCL